MNQCKRVSDCPTDRLAQCRGEAVQARCDALHGLLNKADQQISDLTHAAPVPPAGDVEAKVFDMKVVMQAIQAVGRLSIPSSNNCHLLSVELNKIVGAHASRLTAERDGLENELDAAASWDAAQLKAIHGLNDDVARLQSELTKAREFSPVNWTDRQVLDFLGVALRNVDLVGEVRLSEIRQGFQFMQERQAAIPIAHNVDESCGQGAEAAKGGHCGTCSKLNGSSYCDCDQGGA